MQTMLFSVGIFATIVGSLQHDNARFSEAWYTLLHMLYFDRVINGDKHLSFGEQVCGSCFYGILCIDLGIVFWRKCY